MRKLETILAGALAVLLMGCHSSAEERADDKLQETALDATSDLSRVAAEVPDVKQANKIVDKSVELTNAAKEAKAKDK